MNTRVKAKNLFHGDVLLDLNGKRNQRIIKVIKTYGKKKTNVKEPTFINVLVKDKNQSHKLVVEYFNSEDYVKIKTPIYNKDKRSRR